MTDTGVVDPIRPPAILLRAWRATPPIARVYLALAAASWLLEAVSYVGQVDLVTLPLLLVSAPLAQAAFVALPAALLLRRADAASATPLLFRGAVALSLVTFLTPFAQGAPMALGMTDPYASGTAWIVAALVAVATCAAILAVAVGLRRAQTSAPAPELHAIGLVAAAASVALPFVNTLGQTPGFDLAPFVPDGWAPWLSPLVLFGPLLAPVAQAALLYVVVLTLGDGDRPSAARRLAATATAFRVVLPLAIVGLWSIGISVDGTLGLLLGVAAGPWPTIALVVAFGLGLADVAGPEPVRGRHGASAPDLRARTRS